MSVSNSRKVFSLITKICTLFNTLGSSRTFTSASSFLLFWNFTAMNEMWDVINGLKFGVSSECVLSTPRVVSEMRNQYNVAKKQHGKRMQKEESKMWGKVILSRLIKPRTHSLTSRNWNLIRFDVVFNVILVSNSAQYLGKDLERWGKRTHWKWPGLIVFYFRLYQEMKVAKIH